MSIQHSWFARVAIATLITVGFAPAPALASGLAPSVGVALATIERDADAVARGRVVGPRVGGPAREIAVAWASVEPALLRDGDVLVETKMANASIAAFESDLHRSNALRSEATEVRSRIADVVTAAKG